MLFGSDHGNGRVDAHAAGVGALVTIEGALVVLRGGKRHQRRAVGEREKRALGTVEGLLHNHRGPRLAKAAREALAHARQGFLGVLRHDDALACGQAVGLHHARTIETTNVLLAGLLLGEGAPGRGGNAGAGHDLLGELLGALHARSGGVGPKAGDAGRAHGICNAIHKRRLRPNNNKVDAVLAGKVCHVDGRVLVNGGNLSHCIHATVARCHPEPARAG